jgi:hypothetical protein
LVEAAGIAVARQAKRSGAAAFMNARLKGATNDIDDRRRHSNASA